MSYLFVTRHLDDEKNAKEENVPLPAVSNFSSRSSRRNSPLLQLIGSINEAKKHEAEVIAWLAASNAPKIDPTTQVRLKTESDRLEVQQQRLYLAAPDKLDIPLSSPTVSRSR